MTEPIFLARVLYNTEPNAMLTGAERGDIFRCTFVDTYLPTENLGPECDRLFALLNKDDKREIMGRQGLVMNLIDIRSMSVGDAIAFTRITDQQETILGVYSCENTGWEAQHTITRDSWEIG